MVNSTSFEKVNKPTKVFFSLPYQGQLKKGLTAGDLTIKLWDPTDTDVSGAIAITITELGGSGVSGRYKAEYTNNTEEEWKLEIFHTTYAPTGISAIAKVHQVYHGDSDDDSAVLDFKVWQGQTPIIGLVTGDFTYELWNPSGSDVIGTVPIAIVELGGGSYRAKFDASSEAGDWLGAILHPIYQPTGYTGVWRYQEPDVPGQPSITAAVNDGTGTSATLTLVADDPADKLYVYYRDLNAGLWTLFSGSRTGSGDLQITGLTDGIFYEFICVASHSDNPIVHQSIWSIPARVYVSSGHTILDVIRQALFDWVSSQTGWTVIWKMPNAPQPALPFVAIRQTPLVSVAHDTEGDPDAVGDMELFGDREFMFSVDAMGTESPTGEEDAWEVIEVIGSSLQKPTVVDTLQAAGIAFVERLPTTDLTEIASVKYQSRALLEVRFRIGWTTADNVGVIETSDAPTGNYS